MAPTVLKRFTDFDVTKMPFMTGNDIKVGGVNCRVTRCGYTGEDGYEVQIPAEDSIPLVKEILKNKEVVPCRWASRRDHDALGLGRSRLAASGGRSLPVWHGPEHVDLPRGGHA